MKNILKSTALLLIVFTMASCSEDGKVKDFAYDFAMAVSKRDKAAIEKMYPDAAKCDSFALDFNADSVKVIDTDKEGVFKVTFNPKTYITVVKVGDNGYSITESHNIFAYDPYKIKFAEATGWIDEYMSDAKIAKQFTDTCFEATLGKKIIDQLQDKLIIAFSHGHIDDNSDDKYQFDYTIENHTDYNIKGEDYEVKSQAIEDGYNRNCSIMKGKDIKSGGSTVVSYTLPLNVVTYAIGYNFKDDIVLKINRMKAMAKYLNPTGNEYKEYLSSKK